MNHATYRSALNGLGILKDQRPQVYNNFMANSFSLDFGPVNLQKGLEVVRKYGFTDILVTEDYRLIFTGPAEAIYRFSPRAAIEQKLNPFMQLATEQQVLAFWKMVSDSIYPDPNIKFNSLQDVMNGPYAPNVIPHPGVPDTNFYSVANNRFYGVSKDAINIPLCRVNGGEQYSKADGPIIIRSPAGEMVSVMHSVRYRDLYPIEKCGGLAWSSFAVNQGIHDWPSDITFYLDANILKNNLPYGMTFKSWRRQKGVQIAAWDNWTLRPGAYFEFEKLYENGIRKGGNGDGFLAAEYLAVGLDTTKFENRYFYGLSSSKGVVHPIHNWSDMDNALRNLNAAKTTKQFIPSRFKGAKYETMGVKSYVELKVIDLIPLSDIPLAVIQVHPFLTGVDLPEQTMSQAVNAKNRLEKAGFKGKILFVDYPSMKDKKDIIDNLVNDYAQTDKKISYVAPQPSSGIIKEDKVKTGSVIKTPLRPVTLPNGLIMANIEVTEQLYQSIITKNQANFRNPNNPMTEVSWFDAVEFCILFTREINKKWGTNFKEAYTFKGEEIIWDKTADGWRLPTDEEWVYAAKGGMTGFVPFGEDVDDYAWHAGNSVGMAHPVAQKKPNAYGLYDMLGNVYEWCWAADGPNRVFRGSSWDLGASDARAGDRYSYTPDYRGDGLGFRVCRTTT